MTDQNDNSSLPILLAISGAVALSVAVGWLLLDDEAPDEIDPPENRPALLQQTADDEVADPIPITDVDATFRKARLAMDADMLAFPPERSALYFYGRILAVEPDNEIAQAELDVVLSRISNTIDEHLAAQDFRAAYDLGALIAKVRPNHQLVQDLQQSLDDLAENQVAEAMQLAQDGDDSAADAALAAAEAVPGRDLNYFAAIRSSIAEIRAIRQAADQQRTESARQAAVQATTSWAETVRAAIETGQLISPPGTSARDLLAEPNHPAEQRQALTGELVAALIADSRINIGLNQLTSAETILDAAAELDGDNTELAAVRDSLEQAYIAAESVTPISTTQLVRVTTVSPRYPYVATRRNITGWAEVAFTVTLSGETADLEVVQSEPPGVFDEAAMEAVAQWTFEPRVFRGQAIAQRAAVRLVFDLE